MEEKNLISLEVYSERIGIPVSAIKGSLFSTHTLARYVYWLYLREQGGFTLVSIGDAFCGRKHSSVLKGLRLIKGIIETNSRPINDYLKALNLQ